jgi:hypothetical protein
MTASPIAILDDERLIREGEAAVDRYNKETKSARLEIIPMARGLLAAKRKYPATQEFGDWLQTSSYREVERNDRAALIKIGEHDDFAVKFMRITKLISPELIWDAMAELMPPAASQEMSSISTPTSDDLNSTEIDEPGPNHTEQQPCVGGTAKTAASKRTIDRRSHFYGLSRAEEVWTIFNDHNSRGNIGKVIKERGGKQIWALILTAIDHGFLTKTEMSVAKGFGPHPIPARPALLVYALRPHQSQAPYANP